MVSLKSRGLVAALVASFVLSATALFANTKAIVDDNGNPTGITLTTPDTASSCADAFTSYTVSTSGVAARRLKGAVIVQFVTDNGRVVAPNGYYPVDQQGDLTLHVDVPPVSWWIAQTGGTRSVLVEIALELYDGPFKIATLGPGSEWSLFCLGGSQPPAVTPNGCGPGFWKRPSHFANWTAPFTPTTQVAPVLGVTPTNNPALTLLGALNARGGDENALLRQAVAALLNAASPAVDYAYSVGAVLELTQRAYSDTSFEVVEDLFEAQNSLGCPVGGRHDERRELERPEKRSSRENKSR